MAFANASHTLEPFSCSIKIMKRIFSLATFFLLFASSAQAWNLDGYRQGFMLGFGMINKILLSKNEAALQKAAVLREKLAPKLAIILAILPHQSLRVYLCIS